MKIGRIGLFISVLAAILLASPWLIAQRTDDDNGNGGGPPGPVVVMGPGGSPPTMGVTRQMDTGAPVAQTDGGAWNGYLYGEFIGTSLLHLRCNTVAGALDVDVVTMNGDGFCIEIKKTAIDTVEWYLHWPNCVAPVTTSKASVHPDSNIPDSPHEVPSALLAVDPNTLNGDGTSCTSISLQAEY